MNTAIIDARGMEPPEPFERAMEALADLEAGQQFTLLLDRLPHPLIRLLERDGYRHEVTFRDDGAVAMIIGRP
ncbi:MAG: DUF2249 domain-containing protein [Thauera sp.]|jgi:uncharacterized protein (DUF2249 family)|nr:DUF2249 domain-containing protein [Thauera sp.]